MTIKREVSSLGRLQVKRQDEGQLQGDSKTEQTTTTCLALTIESRLLVSILICFFRIRYIIYFERAHLKNWLRRVYEL